MKHERLLVALAAGAFALGPVATLAEVPQGDKTAPAPVDQAKLKAERNAAKAAAAKMTPEEKAAAKKAKRAAKQKEEAQIEKAGNIPNGPQKAEALKKSFDATKNDPKPLPTKAEKQKALRQQEKSATGQ